MAVKLNNWNRARDGAATPRTSKQILIITALGLGSLVISVMLKSNLSWFTIREYSCWYLSTETTSALQTRQHGATVRECSVKQQQIIRQKFRCISPRTRCPHRTWWDEHLMDQYRTQLLEEHADKNNESSRQQQPIVAVSFGCNKGDDAVEILAKLSGDPSVRVDSWRDIFADVGRGGVLRRACSENPATVLDRKHPLWDRPEGPRPTHVYCVEAAANTAQVLQMTSERFRDQIAANNTNSTTSKLTISHVAGGAKDGIAYFPKVQSGVENRGLCGGANPGKCDEVQMYTVDTYVRDVVEETPSVIDFLAVDVEGFDWDILGLGGADETLKKVKYLEFEYHSSGNWPKYTLKNATSTLFEKFGLVCYFSGKDELWRLTNCYQDYFEVHQWSNVACVSPALAPFLAMRMEFMFQRQLA